MGIFFPLVGSPISFVSLQPLALHCECAPSVCGLTFPAAGLLLSTFISSEITLHVRALGSTSLLIRCACVRPGV